MLSRVYRTGIENISVMFAKPDKRASWEESFNEAKQKLGESSDARGHPIKLSQLNNSIYLNYC